MLHGAPDMPAVTVYARPVQGGVGLPIAEGGHLPVRVTVAGTSRAVFNGGITARAGRAYTTVAWGAVAAKGKTFRVGLLHDA